MYSGRHALVRAEPNVTPMIDVMLVLLVIFMIVLPAIAAGTSAIPPQGENLTAHPEDAADLTLAIDRRGEYYLGNRAIARDALADALRAASATRGADHVLYLTAHKDLQYGIVRDVLGIAGTAGFRVVGMIAEKPPRTSDEGRR